MGYDSVTMTTEQITPKHTGVNSNDHLLSFLVSVSQEFGSSSAGWFSVSKEISVKMLPGAGSHLRLEDALPRWLTYTFSKLVLVARKRPRFLTTWTS